jgi:hypothetical protein
MVLAPRDRKRKVWNRAMCGQGYRHLFTITIVDVQNKIIHSELRSILRLNSVSCILFRICTQWNYDKEVTSVRPCYISRFNKLFSVKFGIISCAPNVLNYFYILVYIGSARALHETQVEIHMYFFLSKTAQYTKYGYVTCKVYNLYPSHLWRLFEWNSFGDCSGWRSRRY